MDKNADYKSKRKGKKRKNNKLTQEKRDMDDGKKASYAQKEKAKERKEKFKMQGRMQ